MRKLVLILLCVGATLVALSCAALVAVNDLTALPQVGLAAGSFLAVGAVAILSRRASSAQVALAATLNKNRQLLGTVEAHLTAVDEAGATVAVHAAAQASAIESRLEILTEARAQSERSHRELLTAMREMVTQISAINPGPAWSQTRWNSLEQRLGTGKTSIAQSTRGLVARDSNALLALHELIKVRGETLATTSYSATPETLLALVSLVATLPEGAVIVEAGSGLSTVWLGLAIAQSGRSISLVALEHDEHYAKATRDALVRQGIREGVEVRYAPLGSVDGGQHWYATEAFKDLTRVDLLFIDGPPESTGTDARYPAVPNLVHALVDGAVVILDDTDRDSERATLDSWVSRDHDRGSLTIERELDRATLLRYRFPQPVNAVETPTATR